MKSLSECLRKLPSLEDAHWINIVVRRNGKDEIYEGDWIKELRGAYVPSDQIIEIDEQGRVHGDATILSSLKNIRDPNGLY